MSMSELKAKYGVQRIRRVQALAKRGVAFYKINQQVFRADRRGADARVILRTLKRTKIAVR